jgi:hypothetical protein
VTRDDPHGEVDHPRIVGIGYSFSEWRLQVIG